MNLQRTAGRPPLGRLEMGKEGMTPTPLAMRKGEQTLMARSETPSERFENAQFLGVSEIASSTIFKNFPVGFRSPLSHRARVLGSTPSCSAKSPCVMPCAFR